MQDAVQRVAPGAVQHPMHNTVHDAMHDLVQV
jgi:hypothetical protein